jgi:hypothetical protein
MNKKIAKQITAILFALTTILSLEKNALASHFVRVEASSGFFGSAPIAYYSSQIDYYLVYKANQICNSFGEKVDELSDVQIKIKSGFGVNHNPNGQLETVALTNPEVFFEARASCK